MKQLSQSSGIMRRAITGMMLPRMLSGNNMFVAMRHVAFREVSKVGSPVSLLLMNNNYGQQLEYFKTNNPGKDFDRVTYIKDSIGQYQCKLAPFTMYIAVKRTTSRNMTDNIQELVPGHIFLGVTNANGEIEDDLTINLALGMRVEGKMLYYKDLLNEYPKKYPIRQIKFDSFEKEMSKFFEEADEKMQLETHNPRVFAVIPLNEFKNAIMHQLNFDDTLRIEDVITVLKERFSEVKKSMTGENYILQEGDVVDTVSGGSTTRCKTNNCITAVTDALKFKLTPPDQSRGKLDIQLTQMVENPLTQTAFRAIVKAFIPDEGIANQIIDDAGLSSTLDPIGKQPNGEFTK